MESVVVGPRASFLARVEPWLSPRVPEAPPQTLVIVDPAASDAERDRIRERVRDAASAAGRLQRWHAVAQVAMVLLMLVFAAMATGVTPMGAETIPVALLVVAALFVVEVVTDLRRVPQIHQHLNVPWALAEEASHVRRIQLTGMGSPPGDVDVKRIVDVVRSGSSFDQGRVASLLWDYAAALEAEEAVWRSPDPTEAELQESREGAAQIESEFVAYLAGTAERR